MIASSRFVAVSTVVLAFGMHGAALIDYSGPERVQIEGGESISVAALGNSFADLAQGTDTPIASDNSTDPPPLEQVKPVDPVPLPEVQKPPKTDMPPVPMVKTVPTPPAPKVTPPLVQTSPVMAAPARQPPVDEPTERPKSEATPVPSLAPLSQTTTPTPELQTTPELTQALTPDVIQPSAPQLPVTQKVTPPPMEEVEKTQPAATFKPIPKIRPKLRPQKKPVKKPSQKPVAQPKGNSNTNAQKGSAAGSKKPNAGQSGGNSKRATTQGNAAVSNYPGVVFRKISRVKRRRVKVKGTVQVGFRIAGNGTLASVSVLRSSGSPDLDKIAVAQIRRAAPFPPPPAGAKTSFSLEIRGR